MLQLHFIRANRNLIIERLKLKNFEASEILERIIAKDDERRETQKQHDEKQARANKLAKDIGMLYKQGKTEEANKIKEETASMKIEIKDLHEKSGSIMLELNSMLETLPNVPHESVPPGKSEADNIVVHEEGTIPQITASALPHWELATKYNLIDFDAGSKLTGAGFPVYKGKAAKFQRSLISYFLDRAINAGYTEVQPPLMVNETSAYATGQLPDKDGQMYHIGEDNFYLIPTSEVPVTNLYRDNILAEKDFPLKNTAYSACFRREAGSYGKDVRGLNRLHQFDKVEIVQIVHPQKSYDVLEEMKEQVAALLRELELPFRIVRLCGGDLSFTSALTYDFEVFSAVQKIWLEVSSVSNFEDFQANRLKLRFKNDKGKTQLAHTLNGSALALPRIVAAIYENNQTDEGIRVPKTLQAYTDFNLIN